MSECFFGVTSNVRIPSHVGKALDAIAKRHDATFTWAKMPDGWRSWFACANLGEAYVRCVRASVLEDVHREYPGIASLLRLPSTEVR